MDHGKRHMDEELLIRYISGQANELEVKNVREWISASKSNEQILKKLERLWENANPISSFEPAQVDVDRAWLALRNRIRDYRQIESKQKIRLPAITYYLPRVAAVLIFGLLIYALYRYQVLPEEKVQLVAADTKITDSSLPDGSLISLNQDTRIEYSKGFGTKERRVRLEGEAYFEIEPDTSRPFVIEAQEALITVLGTSFNVRALARETAVEVLVEKGLVQLSNLDRTEITTLSPGEKGIYLKESREVKKETDIDAEDLYWLNKTLLFRDTKLSSVFQTLQRLYRVKIEVSNADILNCRLTAKFSNETIDHIIEHISTIFELTFKKEANNFVISGNGCQ